VNTNLVAAWKTESQLLLPMITERFGKHWEERYAAHPRLRFGPFCGSVLIELEAHSQLALLKVDVLPAKCERF
jgi:hypothetical protein